MALFNSFQQHFKQKNQYLELQVQDISCGISLHQVNKVFSLMALTSVPKNPSYLAGVFNYQGSTVPVIDLSLRLGQSSVSLYTGNTPVVLCNTLENGAFLGLIVTSIGNVIELSYNHLHLTQHLQGKTLPFSAVYQQSSQACFLLNTDALLSSSLNLLYGVPPDEIDIMIKQNIFNFLEDSA
jgi:chemotaxis signal transduction protein